MRFLTLQKFFSLALFIGIAGLCSAQLDNDRCENATVMVLSASASECTPTPGTTIGAEDATQIAGPIVCSGSWYSDDVWFQFTTDDNPPTGGIIVESMYSGTGGEVPELGMAIYDGCDPTNTPYDCFSNEPGRRTLSLVNTCITPNTTYYVRCWSTADPTGTIPGPNLYAGSFSICAYGDEEPEPSTDVVIWSEDFAEGPGEFTSIGFPDSLEHVWVWDENGSVLTYGANGPGSASLASSGCNGAMGFPAGFYITGSTGLSENIPDDPSLYTDFNSQLNSPSLDLSQYACVSVKWNESFQGLNAGARSSYGAYFEYSVDGGETWSGVDLNDTDENNTVYIRDQEHPLIGAGGSSDVRLRFSYDADFYWWIIDNIQVIERKDNDMRAQSNFYAIAPSAFMPVTQIDEVRFLVDVLNRGCDTQTNTMVNCTCIDETSGAVVFTEDLAYGSVDADSLAQNKEFLTRFTPPAGVVTTYTCTYTVSSDEADQNEADNSQSFTFAVTDEMQFRKENGRTRSLTPLASAFWEDTDVHWWEIGNVFYATSSTGLDEEPLYLTSVDFQVNNASVLGDQQVNAWLYAVTDNDFNGLIDMEDPSEIKRLGVGIYNFTGFESPDTIITVNLEQWDVPEDLIVKANTHYFASIEFQPDILDLDMFIAASEEYDYSAAMYVTRSQDDDEITPPSSTNDIRYSHGFIVGKDKILRLQPTNDLTTLNFGDDLVPFVRLNFSDELVSNNDLSSDIAVEVYPNPASVEINLNLDIIEAAENLNVQIVDIRGNVVLSRAYDNVQTMKEAYNISHLSDGIYFMHLSSKQGIQTKRFVVAK